jgi:hypothetical protein
MPHANMAHWRSLITGEPVTAYVPPQSPEDLIARRPSSATLFNHS